MPTTGGYQNFAKTGRIISPETEQQLSFPYHTFTIMDTKTWDIVKQHTLILNPQDFSHTEPNRDTVVQTLGGAYVDDFGRGLSTVSVRGHTGWRLKPSPDGSGMKDGWQAFRELRNDIWRNFTDKKDNVRVYIRSDKYQLRWYNWSTDEYYIIQPHEFVLSQSVAQPLFYVYNFRWTCLRDILGEAVQLGFTPSEVITRALVKGKQVEDTTARLRNVLASI